MANAIVLAMTKAEIKITSKVQVNYLKFSLFFTQSYAITSEDLDYKCMTHMGTFMVFLILEHVSINHHPFAMCYLQLTF